MQLLHVYVILSGTVLSILVCGQQEDAGDQFGPIDETSVLTMGRNYKNPLLRLIGTAMRNSKMDILEKLCSLNRCGEWSAWSACPAKKRGYFGMNTRTRQCGNGPAFCKTSPSMKETNEMDSKVCMNTDCPPGITYAENGFCFMFYDKQVSRDDADKICRDNGSYVININSQVKKDNLLKLFRKIGKSSHYAWIDGKRKDVNSPWEYSYETWAGNLSNWASGQPDNTGDQVYLVVSISTGVLHDVSDSKRYVVCEYV